MNEEEARALLTQHYGERGWTVKELHLTVLVPTTEPDRALGLVQEILDEAGFDIHAFERTDA